MEQVPLGFLPARCSISANLSDTFGAETLWAKIIAVPDALTSPGGEANLVIQGLSSYGEGGTAKLGAVSLNGLKFKDGILGVVASPVSSTFALLNPDTVDGNITATTYDSDGAVLMSEAITIPAGENITGTVESLVGVAALESRSYVRLVSDVNLYVG